MESQCYNVVTSEFIAALGKIAPGRVFTGEHINKDYSHDEMPIYGTHAPEVVVEASSTEEIAAIMRLCNESRIPVTPRGAGTGLVGGAVPIYGGVLLVTTGMNKILVYDEKNYTVTVQPGVLLNTLAEDAASHGLLYPPDPGEKFATLGGNVSTNAGGMRAVKYGCTRDYVKAMTVVLPTGEIVHLGSSVSKTSSGYSLLNLMIGSEGTLGVITEITLKLIPQPKETISLIIPYPDMESCIASVHLFFKNHLNPQALEFMGKEIVISSEAYVGKQVFPREMDGVEAEAYLLVTFDGNSMEELETVCEQASEVVLEAGAIDVLVADTPALKRDAWAARSSFLEAIMADTKLLDECDVVVPVTQIAAFLVYVKGLESEVGLDIKSFGHAGDGNLHIYCCSNTLSEDEFKQRVSTFMTLVYRKASELGGQVSGEHGIGSGKVPFLTEAVGKVNMQLMRDIKRVFDPNLILNPGKVCC